MSQEINYNIIFSDPGMYNKTISFSDKNQFLTIVQLNGRNYSDAFCPELNLCAWRLVGEDWQEGSFKNYLEKETGKNFDNINLQKIRDGMDYDGLTVEKISELVSE